MEQPTDRERGAGIKFEHIRRITGYLVGDLNRWSTAKRCEERDRVKHSVSTTAAEENITAACAKAV